MADDDELTVWLDTVREQQRTRKEAWYPTKDELTEALEYACATAKRQPFVLGTAEYPSRYDKAHAHIDWLLDQLVGR